MNTIELIAKQCANSAAEAVNCFTMNGEKFTEELGEIVGLTKFGRGHKSRMRMLRALDANVRFVARDAAERFARGVSRDELAQTSGSHFDKYLKGDGQSPVLVMSESLFQFILENIDADNPMNPKNLSGNGVRPFAEDHMCPGTIVKKLIPFLLIDRILTEQQLATPGEGVRFVMERFVMAFITRGENDSLDAAGGLRTSMPDGQFHLTARHESKGVILRAVNLDVAKKYGWNLLLNDITKHAEIMIRMIRGEACDSTRIFLN